jgi:hypothetical protein
MSALQPESATKLTDQISQVMDRWTSQSLDYAILLAAVGTISMAFLEFVKAITRARLHFHRYAISRWLRFAESDRAFEELMTLAAGGKENAASLFDQPSGKLMGQLQAAANVALDYPHMYKPLYEFLTSQPQPRIPPPKENAPARDADTWRSFAEQLSRAPASAEERPEFLATSRSGTQARARLGHLVARKLDSLQNWIEYRWARLNQFVSVALGAVFFYVFLNTTPALRSESRFSLLAVAMLGGLIAPFAKDIVTALSGLRTRRT